MCGTVKPLLSVFQLSEHFALFSAYFHMLISNLDYLNPQLPERSCQLVWIIEAVHTALCFDALRLIRTMQDGPPFVHSPTATEVLRFTCIKETQRNASNDCQPWSNYPNTTRPRLNSQ